MKTAKSMKKLVAALALLSVVVMSCSKSDSLPSSESQSRAHHSGGGGGDATIPPVTGLSATVVNGTVYLTWNSVAGATSYWIYRNNTVIAIMTSTNYTDNYATPGTTWTYAVAPVVNSVLGTKSAAVTVTP